MEQGEMKRYLTIIEVSQKQAYIFADNQLRENVRRSAEIACITSSEYMQKAVEENKIPLIVADHLVYSGGGHTILEFASEKDAKDLVRCLTNKVFKEIPEIALFAKTISYDERKTPGDNVKELTAKQKIRMEFAVQLFLNAGLTEEKLGSNKTKVASLLSLLLDIRSENGRNRPEQICSNFLTSRKYYPQKQDKDTIIELDRLCADLNINAILSTAPQGNKKG